MFHITIFRDENKSIYKILLRDSNLGVGLIHNTFDDITIFAYKKHRSSN